MSLLPRVLLFFLLVEPAVACQHGGTPRPATEDRASLTEADRSPAGGQAAVMFKDGAFFKAEPRWSSDEVRELEQRGQTVAGSCVASRDAAEVCASLAAGCSPLPLPHAWDPCHGRGALCSPEYVKEATGRLLAYPPRCFCSCGPEHAAARARDQQLEREPPP